MQLHLSTGSSCGYLDPAGRRVLVPLLLCRRSALEIQRVRWQPQFDASGIKTESTLVEIDCLDAEKRRRLVTLSVWPFGVRQVVGNAPFPTSADRP